MHSVDLLALEGPCKHWGEEGENAAPNASDFPILALQDEIPLPLLLILHKEI